jgi:hypothetical protein
MHAASHLNPFGEVRCDLLAEIRQFVGCRVAARQMHEDGHDVFLDLFRRVPERREVEQRKLGLSVMSNRETQNFTIQMSPSAIVRRKKICEFASSSRG